MSASGVTDYADTLIARLADVPIDAFFKAAALLADVACIHDKSERDLFFAAMRSMCEEKSLYVNRNAKPVWKERSGEDKKLNVPAFIRKHYNIELERGILTTSYIRDHDRGLLTAYENYCSYHGKADLDISVKPAQEPRNKTKRDDRYKKLYNGSSRAILEAIRSQERERARASRKDKSEPGPNI